MFHSAPYIDAQGKQRKSILRRGFWKVVFLSKMTRSNQVTTLTESHQDDCDPRTALANIISQTGPRISPGLVEASLITLVAPLLLATGNFSDLTITCGGKIFEVHEAIVCSQSETFKAMLRVPMLEAATRTIKLIDDELDIVALALEYLYTNDYSWPKSSVQNSEEIMRTCGRVGHTEEEQNQFVVHAKLHIFADKYMIDGLKDVTADKFKRALPVFGHKPSFLKALGLIYQELPGTDTNLKDYAVKFAAKSYVRFTNNPQFIEICESNGELAAHLMVAIAMHPHNPSVCPVCDSDIYVRTMSQYEKESIRDRGFVAKAYVCSRCVMNFN
ncbi:hypothetical protein BGZ60DRAFT_533176 [Tricladium varicosporioides]|nr:hypothetical protein BGZ60DRAFT_533176 [Hymenoscyphus varicosporioides]